MIKTKLVAVFFATAAVLAVSAAPAFAEFTSTNGKASGANKTGPVVLEGGGATLECASSEGKGTILNAMGAEATKGPTLSLDAEKWNGCKAKSPEFKEAKPTVSACTVSLTQSAGESSAKGAVISDCQVKVTILFLTCNIHIVTEKNTFLLTASLTNFGGNLSISIAWTSITTTVSGTCFGVAGTKAGKLKESATSEGANWS